LINFLSKNQWYIIGLIAAFVIVFYTYGCQSTVPSLTTKDKQVTRGELQAEIEYLTAIAKDRALSLNKQDELKQQLLDTGKLIADGGNINPIGAINFLTSIAAIAFGLDRNKKLKTKAEKKT